MMGTSGASICEHKNDDERLRNVYLV